MGNIFDRPEVPALPAPLPAAPDAGDQAIQNARLMERRRQLGMQGRSSTWLTGARGDTTAPEVGVRTLLGS